MRVVITLILAGVLNACGSSPTTDYYFLQALAGPSVEQPSAQGKTAPSLGVGPVKVAGYLERPELVVSRGGFQLQSSANQRWAEPMGSAISRVVSDNLARLTGAAQVQSFPWRRDSQPQLALRLQVLSLDIMGTGEAELRVAWQVVANDSSALVAANIDTFKQPVAAGAARQAEAYSQLLLQFSQAVARDIERWQRSQ